MRKRVSVIVPVYNSAPYLKTCVDSVRKQTCTDFELLLINDGSTDGSEKLCRRFAGQDTRIRFLTQPHKGVSAARNRGLEEAEGEYVFFLDSDDAIHPRLLERLLKLAEKTKTVVVTERMSSLPADRFEKSMSCLMASPKKIFGETYCYFSHSKALRYLLFDCPQGQLYAIGGKLVTGAVARSCRFDEALTDGEDTKYMYQLLAGGADVAMLCEEGYYYREYPGGRAKKWTLKACQSMYACNKYVWFQEKAKGREWYARKWEEKLVRQNAEWHVEAHVRKDEVLLEYTLRLGKRERRYLTTGQMGLRTKIEYWLAFHCHPVCQFCYKIVVFWRDSGRWIRNFRHCYGLWKKWERGRRLGRNFDIPLGR